MSKTTTDYFNHIKGIIESNDIESVETEFVFLQKDLLKVSIEILNDSRNALKSIELILKFDLDSLIMIMQDMEEYKDCNINSSYLEERFPDFWDEILLSIFKHDYTSIAEMITPARLEAKKFDF